MIEFENFDLIIILYKVEKYYIYVPVAKLCIPWLKLNFQLRFCLFARK